MTTYQKIKQENEKLRRQLHTLVITPDSMEATIVRKSVWMHHQVEKSIWSGGVLSEANNKFNGILSQIKA